MLKLLQTIETLQNTSDKDTDEEERGKEDDFEFNEFLPQENEEPVEMEESDYTLGGRDVSCL